MTVSFAATIQDVQKAAERLRGYIRTTPLIEAPLLNKALGFRLLIKAENTQCTGSFKTRGAFNQLLQLTDEEKKRGVIAISSGNHAQGVAYVAQQLGIRAVVVMPRDAPGLKLENARQFGATVVNYNRETDDREAMGKRIAEEQGLRMIHPYNDPRTIAGQGTVGLEIYQQTKELGIAPDAVIANCSGGSLVAGAALAHELYDHPPAIYAAEPVGFNDMQRSLEIGTAQRNERTSGSICDALLVVTPGSNTLPILLHHGAKGLTATDEDVKIAISLAAEHFKIVVEPSGAAALACACLNRELFQGKTVVAIASGGNVDPANYIEMLRWGNANRARLFAPAEMAA